MNQDSPIPGLSVLLALVAAIVAMAMLSTRCHGAERLVTVEWDSSPTAMSYEVFRGTERIATTVNTRVEIRIPYGTTIITVRAINQNGASPMSAPLAIPHVAAGLRQVIEFSADLKTWSEKFTPSARFARIKTEYQP